MLTAIEKWEISEEESASDHNIIKFHITIEKDEEKITNSPGFRFIIKEKQQPAFYKKLYNTISKEFQIERREGLEETDEELSRRLGGEVDIRKFTAKLEDVIQSTCREMHIAKEKSKSKKKGRTVPWWTVELQIMRKRTNALRRRYQRTTTNEPLRESRKRQYNKAKADYQTAIKREKTMSWKKYCTLTPANNPWNEVYKIAKGKCWKTQTLTTLQRPDGTVTETTEETTELMLEHLFPDDDPQKDTDQQKEVRRQTEQLINTADDKEFTQEEVRQVIEGAKDKKAPGPNGIMNEILKMVFKAIPKTITQMYNKCLRTGHFPEKWKIAKVLMIAKPGREEDSDPSMYRPFSLLTLSVPN